MCFTEIEIDVSYWLVEDIKLSVLEMTKDQKKQNFVEEEGKW